MQPLSTAIQVPIILKENGSGDNEISDPSDACMKIAITSFEILTKEILRSNTTKSSTLSGGDIPRIVLHMHDLSALELKYIKKDGIEVDFEADKEVTIAACAIESVLKILNKNNCVGKDVVTFQSRKANIFKGAPSDISFISLNSNFSFPVNIVFKQGVISHTYAYFHDRVLCLFLNNISKETINKIDSILSELFPKHVDL